jgi:hypothetical protein
MSGKYLQLVLEGQGLLGDCLLGVNISKNMSVHVAVNMMLSTSEGHILWELSKQGLSDPVGISIGEATSLGRSLARLKWGGDSYLGEAKQG